MTVANELLDSSNSPLQLARQCVRYLRNALIAKIAGISPLPTDSDAAGTELLQISPDEQRRAARTASLFSEEELTRFLQVMIRTFDELGYRQEQRFHLELGLLKLVHLRRLLPIEQLLSQSGAGARTGTVPTRPAQSSGTPRADNPATPTAPATSPRPAFSPFEQDKNRRRVESMVSAPMPVGTVVGSPISETHGANAVAVQPRTAAENRPAAPQPVAAQVPDPVTKTSAGEPASLMELQSQAVNALRQAKQSSAADAVEDSQWALLDGEIRIETELSQVMLPVIFNAPAEKIIRVVTQKAGISRLTLLAGASSEAATKKPRAPREGSVQARALEHPMVQQAKKLFQAEIQSVIDLSGDE
jgi:DNA polymerase III subunit gamma/tau